ncbi:MAG: hypothetical protein HFH72_14140 [Lachnospiraceae bacterium]|nr:hypothetical protein [Lachnospiraceae bacterium]
MMRKMVAIMSVISLLLSLIVLFPIDLDNMASAESVNEIVGEEDKSSTWWTAFSSPYKIESGNILTIEFNNYGRGLYLWENYTMLFTNDGSTVAAAQAPSGHKEFAIVRADNWGWGGGDNKSLSGDDIIFTSTWTSEDIFNEIMVDAHVILTFERTGSIVKIIGKIFSNIDTAKSYERTATFITEEQSDVFLNFIVDHSYMKITSVTYRDDSEATPSIIGRPDTTSGGKSDLDAITVQPIVRYTFDDTDMDALELAGEANVANGILNLASIGTQGVTYAKIADLTPYEFVRNGVTFVADIYVTGYRNDWTSIIMIGDGSVGAGEEDVYALYHFTLGFSSVGGLQGDFYQGYFGNGIASPYSWDWFAMEGNRNKWMKLAVTISRNTMTTYIDGQQVQQGTGNFIPILQAFNMSSDNYLGASYYSTDVDFMGSMDNVAIYDQILSVSEIKAIAKDTAAVSTPSPIFTPSPSPTLQPTATPSPTPEVTPSPSPTLPPTPTPTPYVIPTISPTERPSPTAVPTPTPSPGSDNLSDLNDISCEVENIMVSSKGRRKAAVEVTWTEKDEAYKYQIYRGEAYKEAKRLAVCDASRTSFVDKTVKKGKTYYYKVRALGGTVTNSYTGDFSKSEVVTIPSSLLKPVVSCKKAKKKLVIYFRKAEGDKYQMQYLLSGQKKWKKGPSGNIKSKVSKGFKAKKTLKIRIRTAMKVNGKQVYSRWSSSITIRAK